MKVTTLKVNNSANEKPKKVKNIKPEKKVRIAKNDKNTDIDWDKQWAEWDNEPNEAAEQIKGWNKYGTSSINWTYIILGVILLVIVVSMITYQPTNLLEVCTL